MIQSTPAANDAQGRPEGRTDTEPGHPAGEYAANDRSPQEQLDNTRPSEAKLMGARPASIKPEAKTPRQEKAVKDALEPLEKERHDRAEAERLAKPESRPRK